MREMTNQSTPPAPAENSEVALLRALTHEQLAQIIDLTRRLAQAQSDASPDPNLLRASVDAMERRLQDTRAIALGREGALAGQILADGASLQILQADRDAAAVNADRQQRAAEDLTANLFQRMTTLESVLTAARDEAKALQAELDRIHASHSWKLTEPLRASRRFFGGQWS